MITSITLGLVVFFIMFNFVNLDRIRMDAI